MPDYKTIADRIANEYGIPPALFRSLITAESGWNPVAKSPAGAYGLTQLIPSTARQMGVNPYDPIDNLRGGAKYLRKMIDMFGDLNLALAAYNAGPGAVKRYNGIPPYRETRNYVRRVMSIYTGNAPFPYPTARSHKPPPKQLVKKELPTLSLRIEMIGDIW